MAVILFGYFFKQTFNLGENIYRLHKFLAQLLLTTSETELEYSHQKVHERVASRVAEQLKT